MNKSDVKINEAERNIISLEVVDWSRLISPDHVAYRLMNVLEQFDLEDLYLSIKSKKKEQGRAAIDPKILLSILLYASMKGIGSSREIANQCQWEPGFRWLLGRGLIVKHVTISNFRRDVGTYLEKILSQVITTMVCANVVSLEEVILDGTKIKASAGKGSFRSQEELENLRKEVEEKLENLKADEQNKIHKAHLESQKKRIERAVALIPVVQEAKEAAAKQQYKKKVSETKISTTDSDARMMRFPDGAVNPGYNAQIMTTTKSSVIVAVEATQRQNDSNLMQPMLDKFKERCGSSPKRILVDSNYVTQSDVISVLESDVEVYGPNKKGRKESTEKALKELASKRSKEPETLKVWRSQMETSEAKIIRKCRKQTEKVNGWIKMALRSQLRLRTLANVQTEILLVSIGYNLKRFFNMAPLVTT
jgi:transposase